MWIHQPTVDELLPQLFLWIWRGEVSDEFAVIGDIDLFTLPRPIDPFGGIPL
jgi:hypothetical protein